MKIAIVGTGIAGNTAAYLLRDRHEITVFEAADYVGGHSNTVDVVDASGRHLAIDTGFIVFNDRTYPEFNRLLDALDVETTASVMSFSVHDAADRVEYCGSSLSGLFARRRNLVSPGFYRMLADILRFFRSARDDAQGIDAELTIGDYVAAGAYGRQFRESYLVPMAAAIWSAQPAQVLDMPAVFLLRFFDNHGLLQLRDRPRWRVVSGGSRAYVERLVAGHRDRIRLSTPVRRVRRTPGAVMVAAGDGPEEGFDAVFMACHSDDALRLLARPTPVEAAVLGAIGYCDNAAVLHDDQQLLPRRRAAWAAWNYRLTGSSDTPALVTYNMNILQSLPGSQTWCVSLNDGGRVDPRRIAARFVYRHPVMTPAAIAAQQRQADVNSDRIFFCGAYWRNGFHEDGVVSALQAVRHFEEDRQGAKLHLRRAG